MTVCICPDAGKDGHALNCPARKPLKRVFDNPDHPQYGPVRRMWVILAQLDMLGAAEAWSPPASPAWDAYLAAEVRSTAKESDAQRKFLGMLIGWFA